MAKGRVRGGDKLRALIRDRVPRLAALSVTVGVQAREGSTPDADEPGVTVLTKAVANEFGVAAGEGQPRVPARSFLRAGLDRRRKEWTEFARQVAKASIVGRLTVEVAGNRIGNTMRGHIQQQIIDTKTPPNAPATIKRKGSSHPLIDSGQMRQSIRYRATIGDDEVGVG